MTDGAWDFVGQEYRSFRTEKTVAEALREIVRKRWKNNAAKQIETEWGLDPKTAKNVVSAGNVSVTTLTKAAKAERWALWAALGEELFGESYDQHLQGVIDEQLRAAGRAKARRDHVRSLEARASAVVDLHRRAVASPER